MRAIGRARIPRPSARAKARLCVAECEFLIAQLTSAATHNEQVAAARSLSRIAYPQAVSAVLDSIAGLPLDEPSARESAFARAAVRLDAPGAE